MVCAQEQMCKTTIDKTCRPANCAFEGLEIKSKEDFIQAH